MIVRARAGRTCASGSNGRDAACAALIGAGRPGRVRRIAAVVMLTGAMSVALSAPAAPAAGVAAAGSTPAAASAPAPSSTAGAAGGPTQFVVKPGQSLSDIATLATQSKDRETRDKMAALLFNANPGAFMKHDPDRLKIGAVIKVPADAAASVGGSAPAAGVAPPATVASAPGTGGASAGAASPGATASAAAGTSAKAAAGDTAAGARGAAGTSGGASAVGSSAAAASNSTATSSSLSAGAIQPLSQRDTTAAGMITGASDVTTGSPASTAAAASAASAPSQATSASAVPEAVVSSGVLAASASSGVAAARATASNAPVVASGASGGVLPLAARAVPPWLQGAGALWAGGIGALVLVVGGWWLVAAGRRRRRAAEAPLADDQARHDAPQDDRHSGVGETAHAPDEARTAVDDGERRSSALRSEDVLPESPASASAHAADSHDASPPRPADDTRPDGRSVAQERAVADEPPFDTEALRAGVVDAALASGAAGTAEIADLANRAYDNVAPTETSEPVETGEPVETNERAETHEPAETLSRASEQEQSGREHGVATELQPAEDESTHAPADPLEPSAPMGGLPGAQASGPAPVRASLSPEFPPDAAAALASVEFSLPPLPQAPADVYDAVVTAAQHGAHDEETSPPRPAAPAEEATPVGHPDSHSAEAPAAPAASAPLVGLGAAHFGALNLDFNLDLPPLPEQPVAVPTPEELAAIARNKLDLAVEYMELGDVAGARALVNEVIESNDPGTLEEARELLAVLAPL